MLGAVSVLLTVWLVVFPIVPAVAQPSEAASPEAQSFKIPIGSTAPEVIPRDPVALTAAVQWPVPGHSYSDGFGWRVSPTRGASNNHKGVDLTPGYGTPVEAVADGIISEVSRRGGLGNSVTVEHSINGQHITTVYGHMISGSIRVQEGQAVTLGAVLGLVGSTGVSTGAHLHFEVHIDGVPIDPIPWLQQHSIG